MNVRNMRKIIRKVERKTEPLSRGNRIEKM